MNSNLVYLNSMVPTVNEEKIEVDRFAIYRTLQKEILCNNIANEDDFLCLVSVTKQILNMHSNVLQNLLYDKLEYLGFTPAVVELKADMSFREKIICFCANYMEYHNNGNINIKFFENFH